MLTRKKKTISEELLSCKITISKHKIEQVTQIKYLKIMFNNELTLKRQPPRTSLRQVDTDKVILEDE